MKSYQKSKYFFRLFLFLCLCSHQACSYLPEEQIITDVVNVSETKDYIDITPNWSSFSKTGLVFYPGGLVDPHAYTETLSRFAVSGIGHRVIIVKMPGNLAVLDKNQGAYMFEDKPGLNRWVIGGHSLGGAMACSAVKKFPEHFSGLVLLAAYPSKNTDISDWNGSVLSITGQFDKIIDKQLLEERKINLSPDAIYETISGGNHSLFGNYGHQKGDGIASITREEQVKETINLIQELFSDNDWD